MTVKRPQRISSQEMQRIAFENPGTEIEIDTDLGLAFLKLGPIEYMATFEEATS